MAEVIIDSFSEANVNFYGGMYSAYPGDGNSFACSIIGATLSKAKFYLYKNGSPTGNCYAKFYAITGTYGTDSKPTGTALATSDAVDVSTLGAGVGNVALKTFTFTGVNQYALVNGTKYFITLEFTGGDGANSVAMGLNNTGGHGGNRAYSDAGTWTPVSSQDDIFYVYGIVPSSIGFFPFF